ncbi:MAG: AAA family ATPase, partial [Candidatus Dormibacteraeota bacterium]|nr:AAA family ATPase [Candidatus Dormibacteraeota bacterium]
MRLVSIDIAGFAALSSVSVDFHPRLTVVLGENESGKSTLHRAVRASLYGIDAGGQGRPVERSDWVRWRPWHGGPYSVALTYTLEDGRRIRVARRLDIREQPVQVLEVGGPDLTDELRHGRTVDPGRFHLGVDEAVFCATAWLGDDGLLAASPDGPGGRAASLQESMERLADSRRGVTAAQAMQRLHDALNRVGTERRSGSPLGAASQRLRELTVQLHAARRQQTAAASEQERLRGLEANEAEAVEQQLEAERRWLIARAAEVSARLGQIQDASERTTELRREIEATERHARFPASLEEPATSLGGELTQARMQLAESEKRQRSAEQPLRQVRRRRIEIAAGLRAIDAAPPPDDGEESTARLEGEVDALETALATARIDPAAEARREALRREIASTGFGAMQPADVIALSEVIGAPRRFGGWRSAAMLLLAASAAATGVLLATHRGWLSLVTAAPAIVLAIALLVADRRRRDVDAAVERALQEVVRKSGMDDADMVLLRRRLPALRSLQRAMQQEQARAASLHAETDALHATATALAGRCDALAVTVNGDTTRSARLHNTATTEHLLQHARASLAAVQQTLVLHRRRRELEQEDSALETQENRLRAIDAEVVQRRAVMASVHERLAQLLRSAGMQPRRSDAESIAAIREACETRRRHDAALVAIEEVRRRAAAFGAESELRHLRAELERRLRERGGAPLREQSMLSTMALQQLEHEAERARRAAVLAAEQARELRVRLATMHGGLPDIADLEDACDTCSAERDAALRRREALLRALELIETASRRTHRDLAPQLAESIAGRLSMITDERYRAV